MIDVISPMFFFFLFSFNVVLGLLSLFWFVLSSNLYVNACVSVLYRLIFYFILVFWCYRIREQESHSLPVILTCLIFVTTSFRDVFKNLFENQSVKSMKMWQYGSFLLGRFHITIWSFPNSEPHEAHFQGFYPDTSLLLWWFNLNYIILIFFWDCFIVWYLRFYISGLPRCKVNGRYMWMGLTPSQV